jgi:hypothetical protein
MREGKKKGKKKKIDQNFNDDTVDIVRKILTK